MAVSKEIARFLQSWPVDCMCYFVLTALTIGKTFERNNFLSTNNEFASLSFPTDLTTTWSGKCMNNQPQVNSCSSKTTAIQNDSKKTIRATESHLSLRQKSPSFKPGIFPAGLTAKYAGVLCSPPGKSTSFTLQSIFRCAKTIPTKRHGGLNLDVKKVTLSNFCWLISNKVASYFEKINLAFYTQKIWCQKKNLKKKISRKCDFVINIFYVCMWNKNFISRRPA